MEKFIIDNQTDLSDLHILQLIVDIVKYGKISNNKKDYCILTVIEILGVEYKISCSKNKKSIKFKII